VLSNNLGGAMFWETSTDDFNVGNISFTESFDLQCILHYRIDVEEAIILL
jgi:GH18 family chitinase